MTGRAWRPWAWLLLLAALCLRAALLLGAPDQVHDAGEGVVGRIYHEELLRGVAARDIAEGSLLPWIGWQVNDFWGGSLAVSLLAAPLYGFFGDHLLCLRAVGVLFQLLLLVCAWRWLSERVSRVAGLLVLLFLAAPPWGYLASSLMVYGTHLELCGLQVLVAWTHLRGGGGRASWLAKGALAGFAIWFGYSTLVVLLVVALASWRENGLPSRRSWPAILLPWAAGAVLGLLPMVLRLAYSGGEFGIYDGGLLHHLERGLLHGTPRGLDGSVVHGPLEKWLLLWSGELAQATFLPHWGGVALVLAVLAAGLSLLLDTGAGGAASTPGARRGAWTEPGRFAILVGLAWTFSYAVSDFGLGSRSWVFDWRYLMPLWPWCAIVLAVAAARWLVAERATTRWAGQVLLCAPVALALHSGTHLAPERIERSLAAQGSDDRALERFLVLQIAANADTQGLATAALERLGERGRRSDADYDRSLRLAHALARGLAWIATAPLPTEAAQHAAANDRKDRCRETLRVLTEGPPVPFQWTFAEAWEAVHESSSGSPDPTAPPPGAKTGG